MSQSLFFTSNVLFVRLAAGRRPSIWFDNGYTTMAKVTIFLIGKNETIGGAKRPRRRRAGGVAPSRLWGSGVSPRDFFSKFCVQFGGCTSMTGKFLSTTSASSLISQTCVT